MKYLTTILFLISTHAYALTTQELKTEFKDRDACFIVTDLSSGKVVAEFNKERCIKRFTPCSSFKIAAAIMGFDSGTLKDEDQIIKWDGKTHDSRPEVNRDQTPKPG